MQTVHRALGRLMPVRAGWRRSVPFSPERIAGAARVGSRYVPRATCLVQALAVQRLLEREGHPGVPPHRGGEERPDAPARPRLG